MKLKLVYLTALLLVLCSCNNKFAGISRCKVNGIYPEVIHPTPKLGEGRNEVKGIVLHHTVIEEIDRTIFALCDSEREASCHVVIDKDGTRYILAKPESITWHAGYSILNGRERCNLFTIGIEFQGNTLEAPLTEDQILSAIEYVLPLIKKYHIPLSNIVTHEQVRKEWLEHNPERAKEFNVQGKVDITPTEYARFMNMLKYVGHLIENYHFRY